MTSKIRLEPEPYQSILESGGELSQQQAMELYLHPDLHGVGALADWFNRLKNKDLVFFNINRHINHTNICINKCSFCSFFRESGHPDAYELSLDQILQKAKDMPDDCTEVHIVGGLSSSLTLTYFEEMFRALRSNHPDIHIQALTVVEIEHLSSISGFPVQEVLARLKAAGLGSLPGGGAEIFDPEIRAQICPAKISGDRWLDIARLAHQVGLRTNATMLFGHIEKIEHRVDHLLKLRSLQNETGGFQSFIPLPYLSENNRLASTIDPTGQDRSITPPRQDRAILPPRQDRAILPPRQDRAIPPPRQDRAIPPPRQDRAIPPPRQDKAIGPSGSDILRTYAVSRLVLSNFQHIKAFWIMIGKKLAQTSLLYGVNDLDGTVREENIAHSAGASAGSELCADELLELVRGVNKTPAQRDTLYNILKLYEGKQCEGKLNGGKNKTNDIDEVSEIMGGDP